MSMYKLIKKYPGLPSNWEVGMILQFNSRVYKPYDKCYEVFFINKKSVENNYEYFFKISDFTFLNSGYSISTSWGDFPDIMMNKYLSFIGHSPKIITEEGGKLYGNDECYYVDSTSTDLIHAYSNFFGVIGIRGKYFSKKSNAEKYLCELVAKKEKLSVGDILDTDKLNSWCEVNNVYANPGAFQFKSLCINNFSNEWKIINFKYMLDSVVVVIRPLGCSGTHTDINIKITGYNEFEYNKNKFIINKWYTYDNACICYQGKTSYGFNFRGDWTNEFNIGQVETEYQSWKIADDSKVTRLLISKAVNEYGKGVIFLNKVNDKKYTSNGFFHDLNVMKEIGVECGTIITDNVINIYNEGEWAEIIEPEFKRLYLGNTAVEIYPTKITSLNTEISFNNWLEWFEKVKWFYDNVTEGSIKLYLHKKYGTYKTTIQYGGYITIGCINNITLKQLYAVNSKVLKFMNNE